MLEVVTPRTNAALISPAEHLCGGLSLHTRAWWRPSRAGDRCGRRTMPVPGPRAVGPAVAPVARPGRRGVSASRPASAGLGNAAVWRPRPGWTRTNNRRAMSWSSVPASICRFEPSRTVTWTPTRELPRRTLCSACSALCKVCPPAGEWCARWCCSGPHQRTGRAPTSAWRWSTRSRQNDLAAAVRGTSLGSRIHLRSRASPLWSGSMSGTRGSEANG